MNLLDANVWLAGIWEGHHDHPQALAWRTTTVDPCAMCRVTQMSVLRVLSNANVMGPAVQTRRQAWKLVTRQLEDPNVLWLDEPAGLENAWRIISARDDTDHKVWTDDYLAAFARLASATLVTFDRAVAKRYPTLDVVTL